MEFRNALRSTQHSSARKLFLRLARLGLLVLPVTLLIIVTLRVPGASKWALWMGILFQALAILLLMTRAGGREPTTAALILLHLTALVWLLLSTSGLQDWLIPLAESILVVVPLACFAIQCLRDSGAPTLRRARQLARQLARRTNWPVNRGDCRQLPEVRALREALHVDASPALGLLNHPRIEVRIAALTALEFRQNWRPGQPEMILQLAQRSPEPEIRAAAVNALANVEDRRLIEALGALLHDGSLLVRQTAAEALLWNSENRWSWLRNSVRVALTDPTCQADGPLYLASNMLSPEAVADLTAWTTEKGLLPMRAALTLSLHYNQVLGINRDAELVRSLRRHLADAHTPAMLRLELARLLQHHHELDEALLRHLLAPSNPSPIRLIAVEALLASSLCPEALAVLHELGRLPNREIAVATAEVVQRRLGIDMGLPRNQPVPAVHTRLAADVARRVMFWATQQHEAPAHEPAASSEAP
jgi:hypothetical protein